MIDVRLRVRPLPTYAGARRLLPIATATCLLRAVVVLVVPVAVVTLVARHGGAVQRVSPVAPILLLGNMIAVAIVTVAVVARLPGPTWGGRAHDDRHLER